MAEGTAGGDVHQLNKIAAVQLLRMILPTGKHPQDPAAFDVLLCLITEHLRSLPCAFFCIVALWIAFYKRRLYTGQQGCGSQLYQRAFGGQLLQEFR